MAIASDFRLYQVAAEVQYDRGIVYLDRCGSLMLKLEEQLGEPFKGAPVAGMEYGELHSVAERVAVRYGRAGTNVTQAWPAPSSPVRVEQLAPIAWDVVSEALNVGRWVTRCSVRFWLLWGVDSLEEGRERVQKANLLTPSEGWRSLFGDTAPHGWSTTVQESHATVRIGIDYAQSNVQGALPSDLTEVVPKYSIILDLDHWRPDRAGSPVITVSKADLKDLIRTSWQRTKVAATTMGRLLGA